MKSIQAALVLAVAAHGSQTRKARVNDVALPYAVHPVDVLKTLYTWGTIDEVVARAALLHDALEDTTVTEPMIEAAAGADALAVVRELTLRPDETKADYLASFGRPGRKSVRALVIKAADRVCNTRDFALTDPAYAAKYLGLAATVGEALVFRGVAIVHCYGAIAQRAAARAWSRLEDSLATPLE